MNEFDITWKFDDDYQPGSETEAIPEAVTVASLRMDIGDDCLTRNRPRGKRREVPRNSVYGAVAGFADWLIENWVPILWETATPFSTTIGAQGSSSPSIPGVIEACQGWSKIIEPDDWNYGSWRAQPDLSSFASWHHRHQLGHASSDLAIPSLMIVLEDRQVVMAVDRLPLEVDATVQFLGADNKNRTPSLFVCNKDSFQETIKGFVDAVIIRAKSSDEFGKWGDWLAERWHEVQEHERNYVVRLRWMVGEFSAAKILELRESSPPLASGIQQLLTDCRTITSETEFGQIEGIVGNFAVGGPDFPPNESLGWEHIDQEFVPSSLPDFIQGYQLARYARYALRLPPKSPVVDLRKTLERFDVRQENAVRSPLFRATVCARRGDTAHIIPSDFDSSTSGERATRFAVVSALGRLLWHARNEANERVCAAQGDHSMLSHSRRANAFATELLLPRDVIRDVDPNKPAVVERISETYGISQSAVVWHARNIADESARGWDG